MESNILWKKLAKSIITLSIVNAIAVYLHWYSLVWWFDMPMHFLGGLSVFYASAILWKKALKWVSVGRFLYECIITTILVGVLWEALEFYLHINYGSPDFVLMDSFSDIFFDLSGALCGAMVIAPQIKHES